MSAVSAEGLGIAASCPDPVATNTNTAFEGTVNYRLVNSGPEDAVINVLVELFDSSGHHTQELQSFLSVAAGSSSDFDHTLRLAASYDEPGRITVTMQITFSGDMTLSDFTNCNFDVQ